MARTRKVKLHVSTNNNENGVLRVMVTPWRVRLDEDDSLEWELDAHGPAANDILWFRVEQIDPVNAWPFDPAPPDPMYTGIGGAKVKTPPKKNDANEVADVVAYGLTIGFKDDSGRIRTMYIDPDMVIDS